MQPVTVETVNSASPPRRAEARLAADLADALAEKCRPSWSSPAPAPRRRASATRSCETCSCGVPGEWITLLGAALAVPGAVVDLTPASTTEAA